MCEFGVRTPQGSKKMTYIQLTIKKINELTKQQKKAIKELIQALQKADIGQSILLEDYARMQITENSQIHSLLQQLRDQAHDKIRKEYKKWPPKN
jgi:ABC-type uncharacterized transport system involved in gliding motility auxiliary subunit